MTTVEEDEDQYVTDLLTEQWNMITYRQLERISNQNSKNLKAMLIRQQACGSIERWVDKRIPVIGVYKKKGTHTADGYHASVKAKWLSIRPDLTVLERVSSTAPRDIVGTLPPLSSLYYQGINDNNDTQAPLIGMHDDEPEISFATLPPGYMRGISYKMPIYRTDYALLSLHMAGIDASRWCTLAANAIEHGRTTGKELESTLAHLWTGM